ncbi:hypothetical protein [Streptomyces sp. NPDC013187]|uniref:hypothetical protein n=1 Tax=Streptomyces sp. NPDC013187 TaxID=3364865 RepID=UPI003675D36A
MPRPLTATASALTMAVAVPLTTCRGSGDPSSDSVKGAGAEHIPSATDPHVAYVVTLQKSEQGVWRTVSTASDRGGCS